MAIRTSYGDDPSAKRSHRTPIEGPALQPMDLGLSEDRLTKLSPEILQKIFAEQPNINSLADCRKISKVCRDNVDAIVGNSLRNIKQLEIDNPHSCIAGILPHKERIKDWNAWWLLNQLDQHLGKGQLNRSQPVEEAVLSLQRRMDQELLRVIEYILAQHRHLQAGLSPIQHDPSAIRAWLASPVNQPLILQVRELYLSMLQLTIVPPEIRYFTGLKHLDLNCNKISSLSPSTFRELRKLQSLNLSFNKLTNLPRDVFHPCVRLKNLSLCYNNLVDICFSQLFSDKKNLQKVLAFTGNPIHEAAMRLTRGSVAFSNDLLEKLEIDPDQDLLKVIGVVCKNYPDLLQELTPILADPSALRIWLKNPINQPLITQITTLNLSQSNLRTIPPELQYFTGLVDLDISYNLIISVSPQAFTNFSQLKNLNLAGNFLHTLPAHVFDQLTQLHSLNISNNLLKNLPAHVFDSLSQLQHLNLSWNLLWDTLPPNIFDRLFQLQSLNLRRNNLTSLSPDTFDQLTELQYLNISSNYFERPQPPLPPGIFDKLTNLKRLILEQIHLRNALPPNLFDGLSNLEFLDLRNNEPSYLPSLENLVNFKALTHLYIGESHDGIHLD